MNDHGGGSGWWVPPPGDPRPPGDRTWWDEPPAPHRVGFPIGAGLVLVVVLALAGGGLLIYGLQGSPKTPTPASASGSGGGAPTAPSTPAPSTPVPSAPATTTVTPTPSSSAATFITPAVEQAVVRTVWLPFSDALALDDLGTLRNLTTPSAFDTVTGALDCGCQPWPPAYTSVSFSAPPQTSYPLSFLAEFDGQDYDHSPMTKEVVFTQAAAGAPWLVAYVGAFFNGTPVFTPGADLVTAAPALQVPLSTPENAFVQYFQQIDSTGNDELPSGLGADTFLQQETSDSLTHRQDDLRAGWTDTFTHSLADSSNPFPVSPPGSETQIEACFTMRYQDVVTAPASDPIVQLSGEGPFPASLAAGTYSSVTETGDVQICFVADLNGEAWMTTNWGGYRSFSGTPAPASG